LWQIWVYGMRIKGTFLQFQTHVRWVPYDYSKVLLALLALFISYVNVSVFNDLGGDWFKLNIVV